jgi:hypothetical protein
LLVGGTPSIRRKCLSEKYLFLKLLPVSGEQL